MRITFYAFDPARETKVQIMSIEHDPKYPLEIIPFDDYSGKQIELGMREKLYVVLKP